VPNRRALLDRFRLDWFGRHDLDDLDQALGRIAENEQTVAGVWRERHDTIGIGGDVHARTPIAKRSATMGLARESELGPQLGRDIRRAGVRRVSHDKGPRKWC